MSGHEHTLDKKKIHHKWDKSVPPAIMIEPGDTVHCEADEVTSGQVTPGCSADIFASLNFDLLYPLAGPYLSKAQSRVTFLKSRSCGCSP